MRKFLFFLIVLLLVGIGIAWFLGWYRVVVTSTPERHGTLVIDVNVPKIEEDWDSLKQRVLQRETNRQPDSSSGSSTEEH